METLACLVCAAFLEKKAKKEKGLLLSFLPSSQKQALNSLPTPSLDLCHGFNLTTSLIEQVHYSWFAPFLRTLKEQEIKLFLSVFPEEKGKKLQKTLLFSGPLVSLSPLAKEFLQKKLIQEIIKDSPNLLPCEALSPEGLNILADFSTQELRLLIEFLGLHDLAIEMRQIIDTVKIKKIYALLSKDQTSFLQSLAHKREPILFKRMELSRWNGHEEELLKLIQKRGMNRLAKALYPEDPNLVWHVKHHMSQDEALIFSSLFKKLPEQAAYHFLKEQILEVSRLFKKHQLQVDL